MKSGDFKSTAVVDETMAEAFLSGWDILKDWGRERQKVVDSLEAGDMGPVPTYMTGLAGMKSSRHYNTLLHDLFRGDGQRRHLIEPFFGAGGVAFAVRAPETTIANELDPLKVLAARMIRDNPDAMRWDPREAYSVGIGEPMPAGMPGEVTPEMVAAWRAMDAGQRGSQGLHLPEDRMFMHQPLLYQYREEMNDILRTPNWETNPALQERMARLFLMTQPLHFGGFARRGKSGLYNFTTRGPSKATKDAMAADFPDVLADMKQRAEIAAQDPNSPISARMATGNLPFFTRLKTIEPDVMRDYSPWSEVMRQGDWNIYQGDFADLFDTGAYREDLRDADEDVVISDPPYWGAKGEHGWDEEQQRGLIQRLGDIAQAGIPVLSFNSHMDFIEDLNRAAGLQHVHYRNIPGQKGKIVPESLAWANLPVTEEDMADIRRYVDASAVLPRGWNRASGWEWMNPDEEFRIR